MPTKGCYRTEALFAAKGRGIGRTTAEDAIKVLIGRGEMVQRRGPDSQWIIEWTGEDGGA